MESKSTNDWVFITNSLQNQNFSKEEHSQLFCENSRVLYESPGFSRSFQETIPFPGVFRAWKTWKSNFGSFLAAVRIPRDRRRASVIVVTIDRSAICRNLSTFCQTVDVYQFQLAIVCGLLTVTANSSQRRKNLAITWFRTCFEFCHLRSGNRIRSELHQRR